MLQAGPTQRALLSATRCCSARAVAANAAATMPSNWPTLSFPSRAELDSRYKCVEKLGEGTFAVVYAAIDKATGCDVAIKRLNKGRNAKTRVQELLNELEVRNALAGVRNAVSLHGVFECNESIYFVEELCCGGDVQGLLAAEGVLSEEDAGKVMRGVLQFLADAHARNIAVGDVKPANFAIRDLYPSIQHLIDPSKPRGELAIRAIDFGCCQKFGDGCLLPKFTGTPVYMAPEVLKGCPGLEMDVWATGVVLYELLSGRFPFWAAEPAQLDAMTPAQLRQGILQGDVLLDADIWECVSPDAKDLIARMLDRSVGSRITAAQALQHPWMQRYAGC
jgi:calcium-dependent protein kinase